MDQKFNKLNPMQVIAQLVDEHMCKPCSQYGDGCDSFTVIKCTELFMQRLNSNVIDTRKGDHNEP